MITTMNKPFSSISLYCFIIACFVVFPLKATSITELLANEQFNISIRLQTPNNILVKQAVVLEIETSTQHWFAKGTQLDNPQIANTVILPSNQFAINSTKIVKGITWASQIRELTLYPLKEGKYQIPSIGVFVSIKIGASNVVEGKVYTPPLSFTAKLPAELTQIDSYTVSSDFKISIKDGIIEDRTYNIGDAVTQVITFSGDDVPAMMLPSYTKPELNGVSTYHNPLQLQDRISRGSLKGERTESFTYFFEQAGEYYIPEQSFYWWNLTTNTLSSTRVPSQHWIVTEIKEQGSHLADENQWSKTKLLSIIALSALFLLCLFFLLYIKNSVKFKAIKNSHTNKNYKTYYQAYIKAIKQKQYRLACTYLYKIYDINANQYQTLRHCFNQQVKKQNLLEKLLQLAYQNSQNDSVFTLDDAKSLLPSKGSKTIHLKKDIKKIRLNT